MTSRQAGQRPERMDTWNAPARPAWLAAMLDEGTRMDIASIVSLDEATLLETARRNTGLDDFGDDEWREPFAVLLKSLAEEAELNLMGRLMTRSDLLIWLQNRLQITDWYHRHPQIDDEQIREPVFIAGLPRSGTSILFELLSQDPDCRVPLTWEAMLPCPPPREETYDHDARIEYAHGLTTQWSRVVPEYGTMHEMGARIPSECGLIMANAFLSDHIASLHQTPSYDAYLATVDWAPAYRYHRRILKLLQWKKRGRYWLLKAPNHLGHLPTLLEVYPDARIVQTHRDPIKCMASTTDLLGALLWMRSDKHFESSAFEDLILGEATAGRLEMVMRQRDEGLIPAAQIVDSRYQDLMADATAAVRRIYDHFDWDFSDAILQRIGRYLAAKPQGKFGVHRYDTGDREQVARERDYFRRYQQRYDIPDEV